MLEEQSKLKPSEEQVNVAQPKMMAVEGQVILLRASEVPEGVSPRDHVLSNWSIASEFQLLPIPNCMLRGVTFKTVDDLVVQRGENEQVKLVEDNMPPHMHHSAITTGADIQSATASNE